MTISSEQGRAALERFLGLSSSAEGAGVALSDRHRGEGDEYFAHAILGQVSWVRSRHDLVLDGLLLPGGQYPFSLTRMFADMYDSRPDGRAFQDACAATEDYWWKDRLGIADWDWQAGLPPGWAELAARTPRVRDDWQPPEPKPRGWRRLLGVR